MCGSKKVCHVKDFMGLTPAILPINNYDTLFQKISNTKASLMVRVMDDNEIKCTMFNIGDNNRSIFVQVLKQGMTHYM